MSPPAGVGNLGAMTKLSAIQREHDADADGRWIYWTGTIYAKVRRFQTREYQRAIRVAQASVPDDPNATPEEVVKREERVGELLIPAIARYVLVDWWGVDAETEPRGDVSPTTDAKPALVAVVDGVELRTLTIDGIPYRPLFDFEKSGAGGGWQAMEPYTAERGIEALSDPRCVELLNLVRASAHYLDIERVKAQVDGLGKLRSTSSGSSSTASTSRN